MFRPLHHDDRVALVFEPADDLPTDPHRRVEGLADPAQPRLQRAEVHRSRARCASARGSSRSEARSSSPSPTPGIGIAPEDRARIFEEFEQVEGPLQTATEGHRPRARRLAAAGGRCSAARSASTARPAPDRRSRSRSRSPTPTSQSTGAARPPRPAAPSRQHAAGGKAAIVIDDDEMARYLAVHALNVARL